MKKNMSLQRAMRLGLIKDCEIVDAKSIFNQNNENFVIGARATGYWHVQYFKYEKLKWYYMEIDNKPYIVSQTTKTLLYLGGKEGSLNRNNIMRGISKLYSNDKKQIIAEHLSVEMFDKIVNNHHHYINRVNNYFSQGLTSSWLSDGYGEYDGVFYVNYEGVVRRNWCCLYDDADNSKTVAKTNCFFIDLSDKEIFVDMAYHRKHGIWKFIL